MPTGEMTFRQVLRHRIENEQFKSFLTERGGAIDLMCWMDIDTFRRTLPEGSPERHLQARRVRNHYFTMGYLFGPNSPASDDAMQEVSIQRYFKLKQTHTHTSRAHQVVAIACKFYHPPAELRSQVLDCCKHACAYTIIRTTPGCSLGMV